MKALVLVSVWAAGCSSLTSLPEYSGSDTTPLALSPGADPPVDADGRVARDATLLLLADDYPDPDAVRFGVLVLRSGLVNLDVELSVDLVARAVRIHPRVPLAAGAQYELKVAGGLRALDGRVVDGVGRLFTFEANAADAHPPAPAKVAYAEVAAIFNRACNDCHSSAAGQVPARGLDLEKPKDPVLGLVGVPAVGVAGTAHPLLRVAPGDSARSDLLRKLLVGHLAVDGARMPPGRPLRVEWIRAIQQWIDQGASLD